MSKQSQPHYRSLVHYRRAKAFIKRNRLDKELDIMQLRGTGRSSFNLMSLLVNRGFYKSECNRKFQFPIILKK